MPSGGCSQSCRLILHDDYGYQVIADRHGVYLNGLRFIHADPDDFVMIDKLTGKMSNSTAFRVSQSGPTCYGSGIRFRV